MKITLHFHLNLESVFILWLHHKFRLLENPESKKMENNDNRREVIVTEIPGNKKNSLLEAGGYLFEKNKNITLGTSYRCLKHKICKARLHRLVCGNFLHGDHSHPPETDKIKARKVMSRGKEMARTNNSIHTGQILTEMEAYCEESGCSPSLLGSSRNVKRKLINCRLKAMGHMDLGQSLNDLEIPQVLKTTTAGERFLLYDNNGGAQRIIIFASDAGLDKLAYCQTWLIDGTFKSCPSMFAQLYTIHGVYRNVLSVPFVYAFLPGKSTEVYEEFFREVCRKTIAGPASIISDFELAAITACRNVFPGTEMKGCLFHLTQSIFRKVQSVESVFQRYKNDDDDGRKVCKSIRSLCALAFLPPNEVMNGFLELRNQFLPTDGVREIFRYFQDNYLGFGWNDVLFPIEFWNCYARFENETPRTNNGKEGWHFRFNSLTSRPKPTVRLCIENIRKEERHFIAECDKIYSGIIPGRKTSSIRIDKRLREILSNRRNQLYADYVDFLGAVQYCLHDFLL